ncbi:MAG: fibronectin type III domain-containing protein [Bacteroidales bacterium]|nr:fibronectin type III domain-containing protein [Bacteroidales bacterium]
MMKKISTVIALFAVAFLAAPGARAQCAGGGTDCYLVLEAHDSYGDGWNGGVLGFVQGGTTIGTYSLGQATGRDTIRLCSAGGPVVCSWTPGSFDDEVSFSITDSLGSLLYAAGSMYGLSGVVATLAPCPACPMPASLQATEVTSTTAVVRWLEVGSAAEWYYSYGTSATPTGTWLYSDSAGASLSGLLPNTRYYFFVYSDCGGDTSSSAVFTFRSACGDQGLPYGEDFESYDADRSMPYCWVRRESATGGGDTFPRVATDESHTGNRSLLFSPMQGTQSVATPPLPVVAGDVEVQLWLKGGEAVQVGYVDMDDAASTFHQVTTVGPTAATASTDMWGLPTTEYQWSQYVVPFTATGAADSIRVVLRVAGSMGFDGVYVDDVAVRPYNSCPQPMALAVTGTAPASVTLAWTCAGASQWQVAYGPQGFDPDGATGLIPAASPTVTVTGLDDTVMYDFYVRTVCGGQYSYWSHVASSLPNLYAMTAAVDTLTSCGVTLVDDGGLDGAFSRNLDQVLVLQPAGEGQTVRLRGSVRLYNSYGASYASYRNTLRIYAGSDTTGRLLASYNTVNVDDIDLMSEVGTMTLWFRSGGYVQDRRDGFRLRVSCEEMPSCFTPYGLTVGSVAGSYAMVSWQYNDAEGEAPGFVLTVVDADSNESGSYYVDGTDRSFVLLGLRERTAYQVLLSTDCEVSDTQTVHFVTGCDSGGEVALGSGTATESYMPAYLYAQSSFSQQLFTAADLAGVPVIQGFKVYMTNSAATPNRQWDVYLDTTSRTSYGSSADYVEPTAAKRYFSGEVSFAQGWVEVVFDSSFTVPAGKSVVMTVNDKTGANNSSRSFRVTTTTATTAIVGYNISGQLDVTSGTAVAGVSPMTRNRRNTIRFITSCDSTGCVPPLIVSAVPAAHSVTLTWVSVGEESEWKVEYRTGTGSWLTATASTTDTTYTVTGLDATTTYAFRVSSLCGDDEVSRTTSATTLCGEEPLPFLQTFEVFQASSSSAALTTCWSRGSLAGYYPYRESGYGHLSNYSLYMGGYLSYIVLPRMAASADSLSVGFYAINGAPDYGDVTVEVGVCTNPADTATFTVVGSRVLTETQWRHVEVDLEDYSGPDGHIFVRVMQTGSVELNIDDLRVAYLDDCRRVTAVTVGELTLSSARLTITDNHDYGNYIVYYGTTDDTATADTLHVSGTTVVLTGLTPNTQYYVWVAAQCAPGSVGRTFAVQPFRTLCYPVAVTDSTTYLEEFESGSLVCMAVESPDALRWVVGSGSGVPHAHSGGHMASVAADGDQSAMLVLPTFDFTALDGDAEFCFYRYQYQSTLPVESRAPAGLLEVYYRPATAGDWTLLAVVDSSVNAWQRFIYTLPLSQGAALYQVALKGSPRGNTGGIFVDDLRVSAPPACPMPADLAVRHVGARAATVAWTGSASAYKVQYRASGALSWMSRTVEYVDTAVIGPLDMATPYEVRVTALCGPYNQSETTNSVSFVTDFCENRLEADNHSPAAPVAVSSLAPVYTSHNYTYSEILVDSATLVGMSEVSGMAFYVDAVGSASFMTNCQIYMGHTSATTMSGFQYDSSFVMVYDGDISTTTTGIRRVRFTTPFVWDGHRNAVLGIMYSTPDYATHGDTWFAAHQAAGNKVYGGSSDYTHFSPAQAGTLPAASCTASSIVPDLTFYACQPVCYEPMLDAVTTTAGSITVDWHNENAVVQLQIKEASSAVWDDPVVVNSSHNNLHSYTYNLLPAMQDYNLRLRRDCNASDLGFSDWVEFDASTDTACSVPTDVSVSATGATTATVAWTDGATSGSRWEVRMWNADEDLHFDVDSNPATLTGLTFGSSYQVAVRAHCCQHDRVVGEYSDPVSFDNICQPVSGLTAQRTGSDVTLSWHRGNHNTSWLFAYGYEGFHPNQQLGFGTVQDTSVTVGGLEAGYIYTFRVRAQCGDGWNSGWSADVNLDLLGIAAADGAGVHFYLQPNPAAGYVELGLEGLQTLAHVSILSLDGRRMMAFSTNEQHLSVDISQLAAGTYFVHLQTDKGVDVRKLIVR